ncbi:MAG: dihydrodipicolinate synthase family protein [Opitutaceae bacterium]|nr:dihydrodipicolinate synthase family protein [Opitutaceae bacterium]
MSSNPTSLASRSILRGIFSAQWLPIDSAGRLDRACLAAHLAFEKRKGITGVLALGSTGEFPFFSPAERQEALAVVAELAAPLPVFANITDIRPKVAIELGRTAKALGYRAVALMPPIFYPVSQADMLAYFLRVAEAVDLPVILYNFPELTGKKIQLETVAAFAERAPMAGIKQSGGEFAYHQPLIALAKERGFAVYSGADTRLPEVFGLGADGCIGGLVNMAPELMVHLFRVCREGQPGNPSPAFEQLKHIGATVDRLTFPLNVAAGIEARGFATGEPKAVVSAESAAIYRGIVRDLRASFQEWNLELAPGRAA